jgi:hypothetical protein
MDRFFAQQKYCVANKKMRQLMEIFFGDGRILPQWTDVFDKEIVILSGKTHHTSVTYIHTLLKH